MPSYRNWIASAVGTLSAALERPPDTSPSMTIVSVCSVAAADAEADGWALLLLLPVVAEGADDCCAPPHAATRIDTRATRPKRRFCINCPPETGDCPDVSRSPVGARARVSGLAVRHGSSPWE